MCGNCKGAKELITYLYIPTIISNLNLEKQITTNTKKVNLNLKKNIYYKTSKQKETATNKFMVKINV